MPASTRPRSRWPAARPDSPSSAWIVRTPAHAWRAAAYWLTKSDVGVPAPAGSVTRRGPQAVRLAAATRTASARLLLSPKLLASRSDLVFDLGSGDIITVAVQRLLPRVDRFLVQAATDEHLRM